MPHFTASCITMDQDQATPDAAPRNTVALPPYHEIDRHPHDSALVHYVPPPPFSQHQAVLNEFLQCRHADVCPSKIIAIDGFDAHAVHFLIAHLHFYLRKDLGVVVRVFGSGLGVREYDMPAIAVLFSKIQHRNQILAAIAAAPSTQSSPGSPDRYPPRVMLGHPSMESTYVYIVPVSPLVATLRATNDLSCQTRMRNRV